MLRGERSVREGRSKGGRKGGRKGRMWYMYMNVGIDVSKRNGKGRRGYVMNCVCVCVCVCV